MGKKYTKILCLLLCIIISASALTGCYDSFEIEDLAYVTAIGIDEAEGNYFNLTFQTAVPQSITGGTGEGTTITSFKTDNFLSGLKKTSHYLSRKINLSHTKIIVASETIAKRGLIPFLNGLQDYLELRPNVNIVVSSEGAKNYIESVQPKLSANPAKYYDLLFKSYETDFRVPYTRLEDFLYRARSNSSQPVAVLTGINPDIVESGNTSSSGGGGGKKNEAGGTKKPGGGGGGGQQAGEAPKKSMSINGLAVFKADKMMGMLNPEEAMFYALVSDSDKVINMEIVDPLDTRFKVLSQVKRAKSSTTIIKVNKDKPQINVYLKLNAEIKAVQSGNDYDEPDKAPKLKKAYEDYIKSQLDKLFSKVTYDYQTDIFGFGELAKQNYLTISEWNKANWQKIFPNSAYKINVDFTITKKD